MSERPCDWPIIMEQCNTYDALPAAKKAQALQMATEFLWNWTDRVYGLCTVSIRPCKADRPSSMSTTWNQGKVLPVLVQGQWFNVGCGRCGDACGCDGALALRLPGPVSSIQEVLVDGVALPNTAYRVDNAQFLVRLDGGRWPTVQNLAAPTTEPGTWEVTYTRGVDVPTGGLVAAGILACQFAKALTNKTDCVLPERIQQVTRQGVTVTIMDDFKEVEGGKTGIYLVDSWVASVMKPRRRSMVYSPDIPRPRNRRTTWDATGPWIPTPGYEPWDGGSA